MPTPHIQHCCAGKNLQLVIHPPKTVLLIFGIVLIKSIAVVKRCLHILHMQDIQHRLHALMLSFQRPARRECILQGFDDLIHLISLLLQQQFLLPEQLCDGLLALACHHTTDLLQGQPRILQQLDLLQQQYGTAVVEPIAALCVCDRL